jgi:serine/threonine-protein kinase
MWYFEGASVAVHSDASRVPFVTNMPVLLPKERVGARIADKYQLDSILGRGGMGVVYEGKHVWTGRPVAVKVMGPEYAEDQKMAERFLREARSAASLRHPNVVDVLDMGRDADGSVYLVLELLRGHSLGDRLDEQGVLSVEETLAVLLPVMDALTEAHDKGIVHRDLKPDNIFLSQDGKDGVVPKLLDFGVAKEMRGGRSAATQTGTVLGTPHYMSPEQARGSKDVGPASDVWALGVVMLQCLTGELVYDTGELLTTLSAIASGPDPVIDAKALHPAMRRALERALRKDVKERFADMQAFALAVRLAAHTAKIDLRPERLPRVPSAPAMPATTPEEGAERHRSVPRFELDLPTSDRPPATPEPAPLRLELDGRAFSSSRARGSVARSAAPGRTVERASGWDGISVWYDNAPTEVRQVVKLLFVALLASMAYAAGTALWQAL